MRDPELKLALLQEMAARPSGEIIDVLTYGPTKEEQQRRHHLNLLVDVGHAQRMGRDIVRITDAGYTFIDTVGSPKGKHQFLKLVQDGKPYAEIVLLLASAAMKFGT